MSPTVPWLCAVLLAIAAAWSRLWIQPKPNQWLINPVADFLIPCGGLVWLILSLSVMLFPSINTSGLTLFPSIDTPGVSLFPSLHTPAVGAGQAQIITLVAGAMLFTDTHFGAGFIRTFRRQCENAMWPYWGPIFLITITAAFLAQSETITVWACKLYLLVVVLHYAQQSLSLLLRYARINNCAWQGGEKILLSILVYGVAARTLVAQLIDPNLNVQEFLGLAMPGFTPLPVWAFQSCEVLVVMATVAVVAILFKRTMIDGQSCPLPFCLLLGNVLIVFSYLGEFSGLLWVFVPAFFHGAQSLAEAIHSNSESAQKWQPVAMLAWSFVVGAIVMWLVPSWLHPLGVPAHLAYPAVVVAATAWHFYCEYMMSLETAAR